MRAPAAQQKTNDPDTDWMRRHPQQPEHHIINQARHDQRPPLPEPAIGGRALIPAAEHAKPRIQLEIPEVTDGHDDAGRRGSGGGVKFRRDDELEVPSHPRELSR